MIVVVLLFLYAFCRKKVICMSKYAECVEYLHGLGFPIEWCVSVCEKYEKDQNFEGLVDYLLLCESVVECYVD